MANELQQLEREVDAEMRLLAPLRSAEPRLSAGAVDRLRGVVLKENARLLGRRRWGWALRGGAAIAAAGMMAIGLQTTTPTRVVGGGASAGEFSELEDWAGALQDSNHQFSVLFTDSARNGTEFDDADSELDELDLPIESPRRGGA